jgi:hypothetical protein
VRFVLLTRHCRAGLSDSALGAETNKSAFSRSRAKSLERRRSEGQEKNLRAIPQSKGFKDFNRRVRRGFAESAEQERFYEYLRNVGRRESAQKIDESKSSTNLKK